MFDTPLVVGSSPHLLVASKAMSDSEELDISSADEGPESDFNMSDGDDDQEEASDHEVRTRSAKGLTFDLFKFESVRRLDR